MANPWISPKTALPKDNERVVFVVDQGIPTNRYRYEVGSYDGGTWWGTEVNGDGYATHCVACWMSLHELPTEQIHSSHDLESIDDVGHCKVCLQAWIGEVMTPGLAAPCTKVKPKLDPMTGHPVELKEHEGFGQGLQDAGPARQQTAWIDARPWIDVTDGEVPPHMLLEKTPPQNGHDIGKVVLNRFFKSLDSGKASLEG